MRREQEFDRLAGEAAMDGQPARYYHLRDQAKAAWASYRAAVSGQAAEAAHDQPTCA